KAAKRVVLLEARAEVERAIALAQADQPREARRILEDSIRALAESAQHGDGRENGAPVAAGSRVRIESLGLEGEVESVQGDDVAVLVRGRRVRVANSDVTALP
ncbi:MAG: MutS2/Smr-associated SH3 domain-containing protein, partial [Gemmatimonadota bacterium]